MVLLLLLLHVLIHIGTGGAAGAAGIALWTASRRATTASTAAAGHAVRGRGAGRTGVARPEWAPQVRKVERRRAGLTLTVPRVPLGIVVSCSGLLLHF